MLNTTLKFSAPPARGHRAAFVPGESPTLLEEAKVRESDTSLGVMLGAVASLALTLAPQASQAAEMVVEQNVGFGAQSMMLNQMQEMANQNRVGPSFDAHMRGHIPKGSLLIADSFAPMTPGGPAHGTLVHQAAREQGFRGPTFANLTSTSMDSRESMNVFYELGTPDLDGAQAREYMGRYASKSAVGLVNDQTDNVFRAINSGAENSVLNLSMGTSKARLTRDLYREGAIAWMPDVEKNQEVADIVLTNYANAFELSVDKLKSSDPSVAGPERQKLQQGLADLVSESLDSSAELASSKQQWAEAVDIFETEGKNSVVVAAGNQGDSLKVFQKDNHGRSLRLDQDFETSVLQTEAITTVGATRWHHTSEGLTESVADYNSNAQGIDVYASGSMATQGDAQKADTFGTSFAAPKVGATMAELHEQNPDMTSDEVEALMVKTLTHQLSSGSGSVDVLDYNLAADYLVSH